MGLFGLAIKFTDVLPVSHKLSVLAKRYYDRTQGDNDADSARNGEFRLLRAVLPMASVVLDCGANVGDWTREALTVNPKLQIHCFEPSPKTFLKLSSRAIPGQVYCNNLGIGEKSEQRTLNVFEESGELSSLFRRPLLENGQPGPKETQTIQLVSIDEYLRDKGISHVDFAKIDVEGNEIAAFRGMAQTLKAGAVDLIQFEYGGCYLDAGTSLRNVFEAFAPYDYQFYKIFPNHLRKVDRYSQEYENFTYQNWILAKRGWDGLDRAGVVRLDPPGQR